MRSDMRIDAVRIRRAEGTDVETIVDFNIEMARETENIALPHLRLVNGVKALFEDISRGFYVIAEFHDKPVGQVMITYEWSDWRNGTFWWIQSVYVLPQYRRMGVFRALFHHIKLMAEGTADVCGLRLYVEQGNHTAKQAYESLGMEESHYDLREMMLS